MPRYRPSATRWRWTLSSSRLSSLALLTKEISESTAGMWAPVKTMKGACFTPRFVSRRLTSWSRCESASHENRLSLTRELGLKINRIVIDPGHGGYDTGTIGQHGLLEKNLCLDVALRLGQRIEENIPGAEVVYTRKDDRHVLPEPGSIAGKQPDGFEHGIVQVLRLIDDQDKSLARRYWKNSPPQTTASFLRLPWCTRIYKSG